MRRVLAAFLVLFALAAGLIAGAWTAVLPQGDRAAFTGRTLAGDPAAAEGLTLSPVRVCSDYLVWEGAFPAAAPEEAELSWRFHWNQYTEGHIAPRPDFPLEVELDGWSWDSSDGSEAEGLKKQMLDDLAAQLPAEPDGSLHTCQLRAADYYDSLPLRADCTFSDLLEDVRLTPLYYSLGEQLCTEVEEYLSIPMLEGLAIDAAIRMGPDGAVDSVSLSFNSRLYAYGLLNIPSLRDTLTVRSPSVSLEDCLLFTLRAEGELAWDLDPGRIPGGWGLYRVTREGVDTVWSLPEGERPLDFWSDGADFFFLSRDREGAYLYLLDPETFTPERRLTLFPLDAAAPDPAFYLDGEAGFLAVASTGRLALLTRENGDWNPAFTADTSVQEEAGCPLYGYMDMADEWAGYLDWAFDGERLAVTGAWEDGDCYAAVYDAGGLAWLGGYSSTFQDTYCDDDLPHVGSRFTRLGPANQSLCCPVSWRT